MKQCNRCRKTYQLTREFWHKDSSRKDGWEKQCKPCKAERRRDYYARHADAERALSMQWKKDNPDQARALETRRRALMWSNGPAEIIKFSEVYHRDGGVCQLCFHNVEKDLAYPDPWYGTIDHIQPLSKGGQHTYENVQLAHLSCNSRKGNRI